jgi:hypothetical protein
MIFTWSFARFETILIGLKLLREMTTTLENFQFFWEEAK